MPPSYGCSCRTARRLFSMSLFSMVSESAFQVALAIELALLTSTLNSANIAAYAVCSAATTFATNIFNFLLFTTMAQIGRAVGAKAWDEIGPRFQVAILTAVILGTLCIGILFLLRDVLFTQIQGLEEEVVSLSQAIFPI